jgi:hypothetical protein
VPVLQLSAGCAELLAQMRLRPFQERREPSGRPAVDGWRIWPATRRYRRALSRASSASRPELRLTNGLPTSVSWPRRCGSKRPTTGSMRLPKRWGYRRRRRCGSTSAGRWTRHLPPIAAGSPPRRAQHRFRDFAVRSRAKSSAHFWRTLGHGVRRESREFVAVEVSDSRPVATWEGVRSQEANMGRNC